MEPLILGLPKSSTIRAGSSLIKKTE
jgi:hypothetical protein